jgi:hypothetical protein
LGRRLAAGKKTQNDVLALSCLSSSAAVFLLAVALPSDVSRPAAVLCNLRVALVFVDSGHLASNTPDRGPARPDSKISSSKKRSASSAGSSKAMFSSSKKGKKEKAPAKVVGYDAAVAEALFDAFVDDPDDPDLLSMEGIGSLCEKLDIDPSADVRVLVLLWKLGATSKPGHVTRKEFLAGCCKLKASSVEALSGLLPALDPGFLDRPEFRDFYKFVFQFSREGTNKTIEKEIVVARMPIVLDSNRAPHLEKFLEFLNATTEHARITMDQWDSFLQFNLHVSSDLKNFEDDGACEYLHIHIHIHTCTHIHMHTCMHTHMHTDTHTHIHMHTYTHAHIHTCTHIY